MPPTLEPTMMDDGYRLEIPTVAGSVATARLFVGAVGATFGLPEDTVGDLKLAISEAVTVIVEQSAFDIAVVDIDHDGSRLFVGPITASALSPTTAGLSGISIIKALFPDATHDEQTDRIVIPLSVLLTSDPE